MSNRTDIAHPAHHPGQVPAAIHVHHQADNAELRVLVFHVDAFDIAVGHGHGVGHFGHHTALALQFYPQLYREFIGDVLGPLQVGQTGAPFVVFGQAGAGVGVDYHPVAGIHNTHDRVTRNGFAATGKAHQHAFGSANGHRALLFGRGVFQVSGGFQPFIATDQLPRHQVSHAITQADVTDQVIKTVHLVMADHGLALDFGNVRKLGAKAFQGTLEQGTAQLQGFCPLAGFQYVADAAAGLAGYHKAEPGWIGPGARCSNDLYRLAALQGLAQGRQVAVNTTGHRGVANVGMDGVGEIHRRCPAGQLHNPALGSKHVDFVREQVDLHVFDELHGVVGPLAHFHQPFHPAVHTGLVDAGNAGFLVLVHPVGSNTIVGDVLHFLGTDLDFNVHMHAEQRRVQRLVAVRLGHGYVVFETARQGLVQAVYGAQDPVTVVFRIGDDAEGIHIHDFMERFLLELHLVVDGVQVFFPAQYPARQAALFQLFLQFTPDIVDNFLVAAPQFGHRFRDVLGAHRIQRGKAQVFQLGRNRMHTQAVGNRGVDIEGFSGDALALFIRHGAQRAHVMQAVCQLYQDHPDVLGHGQGHFLEVLGLGFSPGAELDLGQLGYAIYQFGDVFPELLAQSIFRDTGIFDNVVQHGRHQALMVQPQVGKDAGYCQRVGDVAVAAFAHLPFMGLFGVIVGPSHLIDAISIQIRTELFGQIFNRCLYYRHRASIISLKAGDKKARMQASGLF